MNEEKEKNCNELLMERIKETLISLETCPPTITKEVKDENGKVKSVSVSNPEYKTLVETAETLYTLYLTEANTDLEYEKARKESEKMERDIELTSEKNNNDKLAAEKDTKYRLYGNVLLAASPLLVSILGNICYGIWQKRGYKFEETGTVTSPWLKGLINKMIPSKK